MKVLVLTSIYPTKENPTLGTFVRTQVEYLKRAGIEVEVFLLRGPSQKVAYFKAPFVLRKRLADSSFDLVHAHYSYPGLIARTQRKVPVVVSYCGDDLLGTIDERGRKTSFSRIAVQAGRWLANVVDGVIVKSKEMAGQLTRPDVHIIPHEVDLDLFRPVPRDRARALLGLQARKKYVLFAANPQIPVKRFSLAKLAADELTAQDSSIELLTVYKEPQERLALFMNACDVLVFTSYQEGSPNIVKQAMACNLPIVSTDVGDVRDLISGADGCFICEPDAHEFATRLADALRQGRRTEGRERVRHLSGPAVAEKIIAVYHRVLNDRDNRLAQRIKTKPYPAQNQIR